MNLIYRISPSYKTFWLKIYGVGDADSDKKKKKLAADVMFKMGIENLKDMGNGQLL